MNLIGLMAAVGWMTSCQSPSTSQSSAAALSGTAAASAKMSKVSKLGPLEPSSEPLSYVMTSVGLNVTYRELTDRALTNKTQNSGKRKKRSAAQNRGSTMTGYEIVRKVLMDYKKEDPPMRENPTEVRIGVYIISVYEISEQTMDYQVSMYLRQAWRDPRLSFKDLGNKIVEMRLGDKSWDQIWTPDTFLRNEKGASFHLVTVDNRLLRLSADGSLWYVTKISARLSCQMDLKYFPMDRQKCPMAFESFGYTMDTMYFKQMQPTDEDTIEIADDLQMPQFTLDTRTLIDCSTNYTSGAYPCIEMLFGLRRDIGYFLIQVYVPSILIVILSWVSFWINVDASPARVSLGLLTVLTTTTMSTGARSSLPRVSYIKAIDVWMIVCLVFVFTSLIEYAVVNVLARHVARPTQKQPRNNPGEAGSSRSRKHGDGSINSGREKRKGVGCFKRSGGFAVECDTTGYGRFPSNAMSNAGPLEMPPAGQPPAGCSKGPATGGGGGPAELSSAPCNSGPPTAGPPAPVRDGKYRARVVDKLSRKCFPLAFTLFNLIYWIFYTNSPQQ